LLQSFLRGLPEPDPTLLIGPAVGEDVAAVSLAGEEVLVLKTDPVTLASDSAAHYTVVVNANDLATCGAVPRWFLASLLFPPGTTAAEVEQVIQELARTAECCGMTLCGGHTEITDAVARPVLVGQAVGTIVRSRLIRKSGMRQGDRIILTKRLAVEGSSIIARDLPAKLRRQGMPDGEIEAARRFLETPGISVLVEARVAAGFTGVSAMHDVTEGGLAVAVEELSTAGRHRLRIETDRIPVYPETTRICSMLGLNPLGLIGSGSLLICCRPHCAAELSAAVRAAGVEATEIGEVLETGAGVAAYREGQPTEWPRFEVDEIARLFSSSSGARD
jgi:hydrogenase maturation factor